MQLTREEAQARAQADHGPGIFVGTLEEVWAEARARAAAQGHRAPGEINTERLDGSWWDDDNDRYRGAKDPLTDAENKYYFVLFAEQPWDQAATRVEKAAQAAQAWDPENQRIWALERALAALRQAVDRYNWITGRDTKPEDHVDMTSLPCAMEYQLRVDARADYPIWACDAAGNCLVGDAADQIERIDDIEQEA